VSRGCARAFYLNRDAAAFILAKSLTQSEKYAAASLSMGSIAFARWETAPLVDFLIQYLRTRDHTWRDLYLGERLRQLELPADSLLEAESRCSEVLTTDRDELSSLLKPQIDARDFQLVYDCLDNVIKLATRPARCEVRTLMVGDCLLLQIVGFLSMHLLEDGVKLRPLFATSKNPVELRKSIQTLADKQFDLVCFSPYANEFNPLLSGTHRLRSALSRQRELRALVGAAHDQTEATLRLLTATFDCSVLVHYTANIRPYEDDSWSSYAKTIATHRSRKLSATLANTLLRRVVAEHNNSALQPLLTIDETALVALHGERRLGRKIYSSKSQHPTFLAVELARKYRDVIVSRKYLVGKKIIVTDLDGTLWNGAIGEGAVEQAHSRQQILKLLAQKGVLLAIASKNDPDIVHFNGALLNEKDFVASQINWNPKHLSLKRIAAELNLRLDDFIFIDNSPEERDMILQALPMVHALDANSERTWKTLEWWADGLLIQARPSGRNYIATAERASTILKKKLKVNQRGCLAAWTCGSIFVAPPVENWHAPPI